MEIKYIDTIKNNNQSTFIKSINQSNFIKSINQSTNIKSTEQLSLVNMENLDCAASVAMLNKNNVWVNDSMVSYCHNCKIEFGFIIRKHHCRYCGNIFCNNCTNQFIAIPDFI